MKDGVKDDVLELLLPDADDGQRELAARWSRFLRLLRDDARGGAAPRVSLDPRRAVEQLEDHARAEARAVLEDLLRHHLDAVLDEDTFLWFGHPRLEHAAAWSVLEAHRETIGGLPRVPAPGEDPLAVAARLIEGLAAVGAERLRVRLWVLRLALVRDEPQAEDDGLRELDRAREPDVGSAFRAEVAADLAARALERCDVRAAHERLMRAGGSGASTVRARQLFHWCTALLGEAEAEPVAAEARAPESGAGPVPRPLAELRADLPEQLVFFPGAVREAGAAVGESARREPACAPAAGADSDLEPDLGPGFGGELGAASRVEWIAFERGAADAATARTWAREGEPENELLRRGEVVLRRAGPGAASPRGARETESHAVALAPAFDPGGELLGWLRCEWPHALTPSRAALARLAARAARQAVRSRGRGVRREARPASRKRSAARSAARSSATSTATMPGLPREHDAGLAEFFDGFVRGLELKLRHRRWSALLEAGSGEPRLVATGGGLGDAAPGGRGALVRARAARASVRVEEPAPERTLSADAASALFLPIVLDGRPVGTLVLESSRRRDFRAADEARLGAAVAARALDVRLADLDAWHRRRFGGEYAASAEAPSCAWRARRLLGIARARGPVAIVGPGGSGKRLLARWLHFEGRAGRGAPFARFEAPTAGSECAGEEPRLGPSHAWPSGPGTALVAHLERFGRRDQAHLLERLESAGSDATRVVVSLPEAPTRLAEQGLLAPALARRLERAVLTLRGFSCRRDELAALVPAVLRRVCDEEGLEVPTLRDDAVACLWRQAWPGNWIDLENVLCKVALDREGEEVGESELRATLEVYGVELAKRLPSRHPAREDVVAALRVTRRETGRWNKRRAALYLGWDPDTLVARMRDHRVDPEGLVE